MNAQRMNEPVLDHEAARSSIVYRRPELADGARVHALIDECRPLDLNSPYAYLLLCTHFRDTCAVAELDGDLVGFVSAYRKPEDPSVLFVWQIGVSARARGRGVARGLLRELFDRPMGGSLRYVETTITPSNTASWELFRSFARDRQAACRETTMFGEGAFGGERHEEERLLRIGPFGDERMT